MIAAANTATAVGTGTPGASAPVSPGAAETPFDAILALETVAATSTVAQSALDLSAALDPDSALGELSDGLLADGEDADADDGDDVAETDPLAFLAALLAYPTTTPLAATGAAASAEGATLEGIEDALSSAGKQGGHAAADADAASNPVATTDPNASAPGTGDTKAVDPSLAGKLIAATAADPSASAADGTVETARGVDPTNPRGAEWLAHAPRHAATEHAAIATPARDPRWADDFSTRISLLVRGGESSASLQLTPLDLGPMEVNITVRDSQATIQFGAAQAETRALIENSIPRLREMLAAQGFQLMDASVSQGFTRQTRPEIPGVSRGQVDGESEVAAIATRVTLDGLLDTYA